MTLATMSEMVMLPANTGIDVPSQARSMRLARRCSPPLTWCDAVGIIRAAQFQFYREFRCAENCWQEPTRNGGVWGTPNFRRVTFNQRVGRAKSKFQPSKTDGRAHKVILGKIVMRAP